MKLTEQQRSVVIDDSNRVVSSCPGSGKTRTIIAKILNCIEAIRGSPRRIGCITYTNAAANEILGRLLESGTSGDEDYYEVNTIHSFCLNNIVRPYSYLVEELREGFEVVAPDSEWYDETVKELSSKFAIPAWASERFADIYRTPIGDVVLPSDIPLEAGLEFLARLKTNKLISFSGIVYFAFHILSTHKFVARAVSSRFAWLLVDEFQDTSELQTELLCLIHAVGHTKFFLVGDENQSIYGFAGARPDLMGKIAARILAKADVPLSGNFRCSERIIEIAERLCPRTPRMAALGESKDCPVEPRYQHAMSSQQAILGYFLPEVERLSIEYGKVAILAPWWTALFPLSRTLRERGIPVIGPGARPYRRSLEFAQFAEATAAYVVSKDIESAVAVQRALFFMLLTVGKEPNWRVFGYSGKRVLCRIMDTALALSKGSFGAMAWLEEFANASAAILIEEEMLSASEGAVLIQSASTMILSIGKIVQDPKNMGIDALGIFARPRECIHLMTMHASKGREFDAVAVIDFHDGKVPHFKETSKQGFEEARRLTYVSATRARKFLAFFTDASNSKNRPSPFLRSGGMRFLA